MSFVPLVVPPAQLTGPGRWYLVRDGEVLTGAGGSVPVTSGPEQLGVVPEAPPVFLGLLDGQACWAAGVARSAAAPGPWSWSGLRSLAGAVSTDEWTLAGRAVQLVEWLRTSRYCGRCATPAERSGAERAMRCPACGLAAYPRLAPAVIVLVRRGDEALLARGSRFPGGMYSTLAGFVEPGETLEEAVHREILEEVGVRLHPPRYAGSQAWPFPHSVMIGFTAEWAGGELTPDGDEILDARWWRADAPPPLPPPMSIARRLIDAWMAEVTTKTTVV